MHLEEHLFSGWLRFKEGYPLQQKDFLQYPWKITEFVPYDRPVFLGELWMEKDARFHLSII
jgi:hypothetical protein